MKDVLQDWYVIWCWLLPYGVIMPIAYWIGAFVEFSPNPANWTWNARFVVMIFGLAYSYALHMRLDAERILRK